MFCTILCRFEILNFTKLSLNYIFKLYGCVPQMLANCANVNLSSVKVVVFRTDDDLTAKMIIWFLVNLFARMCPDGKV